MEEAAATFSFLRCVVRLASSPPRASLTVANHGRRGAAGIWWRTALKDWGKLLYPSHLNYSWLISQWPGPSDERPAPREASLWAGLTRALPPILGTIRLRSFCTELFAYKLLSFHIQLYFHHLGSPVYSEPTPLFPPATSTSVTWLPYRHSFLMGHSLIEAFKPLLFLLVFSNFFHLFSCLGYFFMIFFLKFLFISKKTRFLKTKNCVWYADRSWAWLAGRIWWCDWLKPGGLLSPNACYLSLHFFYFSVGKFCCLCLISFHLPTAWGSIDRKWVEVANILTRL